MCDAEDPCSVKTARELELSFTTSPRCTTRPLQFWIVFEVAYVHERYNELLCLHSVRARSPLVCFGLRACHAGNFFTYVIFTISVPSLLECAFLVDFLHVVFAEDHRISLAHFCLISLRSFAI